MKSTIDSIVRHQEKSRIIYHFTRFTRVFVTIFTTDQMILSTNEKKMPYGILVCWFVFCYP